ncbi:MAG: tRNA (adenosine(37)-N6)-dimethylallyltransferase MiaA, partial [Eubacterium sp.]|nr:tRNA (adenosine(37)-N6)-dimethylallyltransferase MiaA [Eubacterium sp.]
MKTDALPLLILTGPTAVGKTEASLELAKRLNGEIINADSMQVYRGMDIGTAKIPVEERQGVPHHLIDICSPTENFDVVRFQTEARKAIQEITDRGHLPILVGGTGFYIQAVLYDIDFSEETPDPELRAELEAYAKEYGENALHERLFAVDPASAEKIHAHNIKRVIRAIEYYQTTGNRISEHNEEQSQKESPYRFLYAVLTLPREELYRRIDERVDLMIKAGLVDEVKALLDTGISLESTAMKGLGYKEIAGYLNGEYDLSQAIYILKRDTRHFAKRQLT